MYLTEEEASELAKTFPIAVCLQAMRSMYGVLHHDPTASRERIIQAIHNVAHRLLMEGKAKGFYREFSGTGRGFKQQNKVHDVPTLAPTPTPMYRERLMECWQNTVATEHDWIPMDDWVDNLLKLYDYATVEEAISRLNRTYGDTEAQEALDAVLWGCEQLALQGK